MKTKNIATLAITVLTVAIFATAAYCFLGGPDPSRNMGNYRSFSFYADRPGNSAAIWMQPGAGPPSPWDEFWFDNSGNFNLPGGLSTPGPIRMGQTYQISMASQLAALIAANPNGFSAELAAGTYTLTNVALPPNTHLFSKSGAVVEPSSSHTWAYAFVVTGSNDTFDGITFQGNTAWTEGNSPSTNGGAYVNCTNGSISDLEFRNCHFEWCMIAVAMFGPNTDTTNTISPVSFTNCTWSDIGAVAINLDGDTVSTDTPAIASRFAVTNMSITNCSFKNIGLAYFSNMGNNSSCLCILDGASITNLRIDGLRAEGCYSVVDTYVGNTPTIGVVENAVITNFDIDGRGLTAGMNAINGFAMFDGQHIQISDGRIRYIDWEAINLINYPHVDISGLDLHWVQDGIDINVNTEYGTHVITYGSIRGVRGTDCEIQSTTRGGAARVPGILNDMMCIDADNYITFSNDSEIKVDGTQTEHMFAIGNNNSISDLSRLKWSNCFSIGVDDPVFGAPNGGYEDFNNVVHTITIDNTTYISNGSTLTTAGFPAGNMLSYDSDFSHWTISGSPTLTADYTQAPDGTVTATRFQSSTKSDAIQLGSMASIAGKPYTLSIYAKPNTINNIVQLMMCSGDQTECAHGDYYLSSGRTMSRTIGSDASGLNAAMVALPNGWFRLYLTATFANSYSGDDGFQVKFDNPNPAAIDDDIWGAQLEQSATPSPLAHKPY